MDEDYYAYDEEIDQWESQYENDMVEAELAMLGNEAQTNAPAMSTTPGMSSTIPSPTDENNSSDMETNDTAVGHYSHNSMDELLGRMDQGSSEDEDLGERPVERSAKRQCLNQSSTRRIGYTIHIQPHHSSSSTSFSSKKKEDKKRSAQVDCSNYLFTRPVESDVKHAITCTLASGERYFMRSLSPKQSLSTSSRELKIDDLLGVSMNEMMERVEKLQIEKVLKESQVDEMHQEESASSVRSTITLNELWLDKYRPQRFIHLLSEEKINREVLRWIKSWDTLVFPHKKTIPSLLAPEVVNPNYMSKAQQFQKKVAVVMNPDDPRPFEKLLLLSGAPGVGKTTLASIIATHAGYNAIEVNASDDRSATVLQQKINNAMDMSCIWSDGRPNCIILDEIDGAISGGEKTGISVLIEMAKSRFSMKDREKSKTSSAKYRPITRPIICICNDPYAPALRPLRKYAKILMIQPPCPQRILSRLKSICKLEQLQVNAGALSSLIEKGNRDIRFCLNALQIAGMKSSTLSAAELELTLSSKDQSATVFDIWDHTFFHKPKKRRQEQSYSSLRNFDEFHRMILSVNAHDLMLQGLHENMIPMIQSDPALYKVSHLLECLEFADECHTQCLRTQNYHLANYLPTVAASFYLTCATAMRKRVEYPRKNTQMRYQHDQNDMILDTFISGAQFCPCLRIGPSILLMDVMPYLLQILCPEPVLQSFVQSNNLTANLEDLNARKNLIGLLTNFGISFKTQFRHDLGMIELAMEPSIELLCSYTEHVPPILPLEIRRFVTKEIEKEHVRRAEGLRQAKIRAEAERQDTEHQQQQQQQRLEEEEEEEKEGLMDQEEETKDEKENSAPSRIQSFFPESGSSCSEPPPVAPKVGALVISKKKTLATSLQQNHDLGTYDDEEAMKKRNPFAFAHKQARAVRKQRNNQRNLDNDTNKFTVRYKFKAGYTCGIKRNALLKDFL